jgi:flagellar basal body-associated protein FliL
MDSTQQSAAEPNFEGEAMKLPGGATVAATPKSSGTAFGVVLTILFLALVLILGGLFFWYRSMQPLPTVVIPEPPTRPTAEENREPESTTASAQAEALNVVSNSNELDAIEADILSTNLDSLDSELGAIDTEIDAAAEPATP